MYFLENGSTTGVTLLDIWKFFSGANKIPGTGFENAPSIKFTDENMLPKVSTCAHCITFSRQFGLISYDNFKYKMKECILGSFGFGQV